MLFQEEAQSFMKTDAVDSNAEVAPWDSGGAAGHVHTSCGAVGPLDPHHRAVSHILQFAKMARGGLKNSLGVAYDRRYSPTVSPCLPSPTPLAILCALSHTLP